MVLKTSRGTFSLFESWQLPEEPKTALLFKIVFSPASFIRLMSRFQNVFDYLFVNGLNSSIMLDFFNNGVLFTVANYKVYYIMTMRYEEYKKLNIESKSFLERRIADFLFNIPGLERSIPSTGLNSVIKIVNGDKSFLVGRLERYLKSFGKGFQYRVVEREKEEGKTNTFVYVHTSDSYFVRKYFASFVRNAGLVYNLIRHSLL